MRIMPTPTEAMARHAPKRQPWGYWLNVARENGISDSAYNTRRYKYGWGPAKAAMKPAQRRKG